MSLIQTRLNEEEDEILSKAAKIQRRSKREQLAFSAIQHARSIVEESEQEPAPEPPKKGARGA